MSKRKSFGNQDNENRKVIKEWPESMAGETGMRPAQGRRNSFTLNDIDGFVGRCRNILHDVSHVLSKHPQAADQIRLSRWRNELSYLQSRTSLPGTTIAVVGATGCGKSSLVNALVDHEDLLPVSCMRACTAVAVEVTENRSKEMYEADITFLSKEEWSNELAVLKNLLTDIHGNIHSSRRDPTPDAAAAYSKLKAVYGPMKREQDWTLYTKENEITRHLGETVTIKARKAASFRDQIDQYITSTGSGRSEYWPIVRWVRIRIPNCAVCKKRVTIVDLPGTGDTNIARERVAENFLKHCHAMFVVADINRAVDEGYARYMLGSRFRRQLLFDGQYNNVSFICTQTDRITPNQVIRDFHITDSLVPIQLKKKEITKRLNELKSAEEISETSAQIAKQKELLRKVRMAEKVICIKRRNEYCMTRLKRDFNVLMRETRLDGTAGDEEDEETGADDLDTPASLKVFCVSATQYQALTGNLDEDPIFNDRDDTQIPQLKEFIQDIASRRQNQAAVQLIRSIRTLFRDICRYTETSAGEHMRRQATAMLDISIEQFHSELREEFQNMMTEIGAAFDELIRRLNEGAGLAVSGAEEAQRLWGSKREAGGYSWNTYQTTCHGNGYYRSREKRQIIDFNGDLAEPMYRSIKASWDDVFNHQLEEYLLDYVDSVGVCLMKFSIRLNKGLKPPGRGGVETSQQCALDHMIAGGDKIFCSVESLLKFTKEKQRTINPILTEKVKEYMQPVYNMCTLERGKGMFDRMRSHMSRHVREIRNQMIHEAQHTMKQEITSLQHKIAKDLQETLDLLLSELQESRLEPPSGKELVSDYLAETHLIKAETDQMCREASIPEHMLSSGSQSPAAEV